MAASGNEIRQVSAAARMWCNACDVLRIPRSLGDEMWSRVVAAMPTGDIWHSLKNCVSYQVEVWENLLQNGMQDVMQPAAFQVALVLRHTPSDAAEMILSEMLHAHPQSQDLSSYILALLTEEEAPRPPSPPSPPCPPSPGGPAPSRDLQLYADCELAVLAAPPERYDEHASLVRMEYSQLSRIAYAELRLKILNQFSLLPVLFLSPEFDEMEDIARDNINREIKALREQR